MRSFAEVLSPVIDIDHIFVALSRRVSHYSVGIGGNRGDSLGRPLGSAQDASFGSLTDVNLSVLVCLSQEVTIRVGLGSRVHLLRNCPPVCINTLSSR
jgi:hypothetical protein